MPVNVLVQFYDAPTSIDLNAAKGFGAGNGRAVGLIKAYRWTISRAQLSNLISRDSNIKYISLDRPLHGAMNNAVPAVGADIAHSLGYDGTGVGVAVIDSGVNDVFDLTQAGASKTSRIGIPEDQPSRTADGAGIVGRFNNEKGCRVEVTGGLKFHC
jgi:hypothetical protein